MVAMSNGLSIWVLTRLSASLPMPRIRIGYSSGPSSRVRARVRRSRERSRSSLRMTVNNVANELMRAILLPNRSP
ncbi:hypothetical protein D3C72_2360490 [compost metagenome]